MTDIRTFRWVLASVLVLTALKAAPASPAPGPTDALAIDPVTPTVLFAGAANGTFKSTNGGATWSVTGLTTPTYSLVIDLLTMNTVYAGTDSGFSKARMAG